VTPTPFLNVIACSGEEIPLDYPIGHHRYISVTPTPFPNVIVCSNTEIPLN
jgi:hypothetical protein